MTMKTDKWITKFEPFAGRLIEKYQVPGTALAVSHHGKMIYKEGKGYRNVDEKLEVTENTLFGIASITKSFTAIAIMQLQERGSLTVNDPVVRYLPEFKTSDPAHTERVTIHHFLTHTSGLPTLPTLYYAMKRTMENDSSISEQQMERLNEHEPIDDYEQLMSFVGELTFDLLGEPGTEFSYSNDAYALLGAIVERVSGMPYDEYVTENILKPLNMTSSTFDLNRVIHAEDVTTLYASKEEDGEKEIYKSDVWWDAPAMLAGGFLRSTLKDMMKYTELYLNDGTVHHSRILTPESLREMVHPHVQYEKNKYYGYGLMITPDYNGATLVEHGGSLKGVSSHLSVVPEKRLAGVVLTNIVGVPVSSLLLGALNAVQGVEPDTPLQTYQDYEVQADLLEKYCGTFTSGEGAEINVTKKDNQLLFESEGESYSMRPVDRHLFTVEMNESETPVRFLVNDEQEVYGIFLGVRQLLKGEVEQKSESV